LHHVPFETYFNAKKESLHHKEIGRPKLSTLYSKPLRRRPQILSLRTTSVTGSFNI